MSRTIAFIERKYWKKGGVAYSIERVFLEVSAALRDTSCAFFKLPFGNRLTGILCNLLFFRRPDADIYHVTGVAHYIVLRLPRRRTVLTIHDLGFLHFRKGLRRIVLKKLMLDWPIARAARVTAVSETTRKEILEHCPAAEGKLEVIENPLFSGFGPVPYDPVMRRRPIILQVGITPNKNIPRLLKALEGIDCVLRIVGVPEMELTAAIAASEVETEVVSGLSDSEMRDAYANADVVAFCSTFEGFGLPILEAQSVGRPLVTSELSPMRDVAGSGAMLADPYDPESIRNAIVSLLESPEKCRRLVELGHQNVKRFDIEMIASRYSALYDQLLHQITDSK